MSSETQLSAVQQQLPPPKYSRYRSVRKAHGTDATSSPALPSPLTTSLQDAAFARPLSRYHRKLKSADNAAETVADLYARPAAALHSHPASLAALTGEKYPVSTVQDIHCNPIKALLKGDGLPSISTQTKSISRPTPYANPRPTVASDKEPPKPQHNTATTPVISRIATSEREVGEVDGEDSERLKAQEERIRRIKAKQSAAREFERSKRRASGNETESEGPTNSEKGAGKAEMPKSQTNDCVPTTIRERPTRGPALEEAKVASPNKVRNTASTDIKVQGLPRLDLGEKEPLPPAVRTLSLRRKRALPAQRRSSPPQQELNMSEEGQPTSSRLSPSKASGTGHVTSDIPRSAVNAGERRVVIKYNESVISLPVTPATTSEDLLNSTSTRTSGLFDPEQCVLSECFTQLGLERPLRKYEHVRDVMNSWDYDSQNHLIVIPSSANVPSKGDLDPKALPKQPCGTSLYMYHSQRPGKWDKRWVSLKEDGQISLSKRQDGQESSSICRLSDFDIYKPTQRQMKKLRPPKKVCFAIKSQQKSAMFLNGANFVHFFATSDGPLTETWYSAVRTWRSWYLVNMLGEGQEQGIGQISSWGNSAGPQATAFRASGQNQLAFPRQWHQSTPELPIDKSPTKANPRRPASKGVPTRNLSEVSLRGRSAPPSSFPNYQIKQPGPSVPSSTSRRAPSVGRGGERTPSIRSNAEAPSTLKRSASLSRAGSIRQPPKPLVDLTPQFQEQPHHLRKGRGVAPVPGKPLVALATDVEGLPGAVITPAARAWQRPQNIGHWDNADEATAVKIPGGFAGPPSDDMAFTGTGLLGRNKSKRAQGGIGHGYGVKTGDRNDLGKPLVDLRIESRFADGSLLRQVEKYKGEDERGLIVDRTKRTERDIRVGEGI